MRAAMPPHQKIKIVRPPSAAAGPDALAVQCCGEACVGGHPRRAQLVEQEAEMSRSWGPIASSGCHGVLFGLPLIPHNMVIAEGFSRRSGLKLWVHSWNAGTAANVESAGSNTRKLRSIMSILAWIVVGLLAGWLAERITGRNHGLLMNLIVGIIGAFLGGFLFTSLLGFRYEEGFNLPSIVVATVGAVVLLAVTGGFRTRRTWP
jgi:uncharacterized membrane protein YeaQ/YmgE (transglycosylase-associated protein family)